MVESLVEVEGKWKVAATYVRSGQNHLTLNRPTSRPPPTGGEVLPILNDGRQTRRGVAVFAVDRMSNQAHEALWRFEVVEVGTRLGLRPAVDQDKHELAKSTRTTKGNSHVAWLYCTAVVSFSPGLERFPDFFVVYDTRLIAAGPLVALFEKKRTPYIGN